MAKTVKELKEDLKTKIAAVKGKTEEKIEKLKTSYAAKIEKAGAK